MKEGGRVVGNVYDKYASRNPVTRLLMRGYISALSELVATASPDTIHDVGCGEGYWVLRWNRQGLDAFGSDISTKVIALARQNAARNGFSDELFRIGDIYKLTPDRDGADLLTCCEVLEHLDHPTQGLAGLRRAAEKHVLLSVPQDPIWRVLNMLRGRYWTDLGNTPGHLQHWSRKEFVDLVAQYFDIIEIRSPLPWTMILARVPG